VNPPVLDDWFPAGVIQARIGESFGRYPDDVFFLDCWFELRLDGFFPFSFHDLLDPGLAEVVPFSPKSGFAHTFEGFIDENAAAETP